MHEQLLKNLATRSLDPPRAPAPPVFLVARGFFDDRDLACQGRPARA
jgi:hypothetical protein